MTKGNLDRAKRRALAIFDDWNRVTGAVPDASGWRYELEGIIEDAVECGAQEALGIRESLESEKR